MICSYTPKRLYACYQDITRRVTFFSFKVQDVSWNQEPESKLAQNGTQDSPDSCINMLTFAVGILISGMARPVTKYAQVRVGALLLSLGSHRIALWALILARVSCPEKSFVVRS
jgi:hypothetical protein